MKWWLFIGAVLITSPAWIAILLVILTSLFFAYPIVRLVSRKGVRHG